MTPTAKAEARHKRQEHRSEYSAALAQAQSVVRREAEALHATFGGHSIRYYEEEILQIGCLNKQKRQPSRWNAYLRAETKHRARYERHKVNDLAAEIAKAWNAMTPEEQKTATDPLLIDLQEHRDSMAFGHRNVQLESVGDATQTLASLEYNLKALHARTGTEVILLAVRSSVDAYLRPFATCTSVRATDFFYNTLKLSIHDVCARFEAYSLAGVEGVVNKHGDGTAQLKSELTSIINENLEALVGPKTRMVYVNFEEKFTWNLGICLEGWPLPRFCSPSDLKTRAEVTLLLSAWKSGTTHFRQMGQEEWKEWRGKRETSATATSDVLLSNPSPAESIPSRPPSPQQSPQEELHTTSPSRNGLEPVPEPIPDRQGPGPTSTGTMTSSGRKRKSVEFVHASGVTSATGNVIITAKRHRKERSDKGVKRGSRKTTASTSTAMTTPL
ncbi:hypothetical protein C0992_007081 [Termitomyces sp. T32_za158]|nr:hypothetical protein C0992_007081 [Termitomyces sp. T32_za158]